jgi:hypothetical protein
VYVGLVTVSSIPSPRAMPAVKQVFPAPRPPCKAIILPGRRLFAIRIPRVIVSSGEEEKTLARKTSACIKVADEFFKLLVKGYQRIVHRLGKGNSNFCLSRRFMFDGKVDMPFNHFIDELQYSYARIKPAVINRDIFTDNVFDGNNFHEAKTPLSV